MFDRFTLDEVSAKIWWPLAMVALVALVLTVPAANHAADRARREAAARAIVISTSRIEPLTKADASVEDMDKALANIQQADPTFDVVRLWDDQRLLVASSVDPDPLRQGTAFNDNDINGALSNGSRLVVTDRLPTGDPGATTVHAYTKIEGGSRGPMVTEFEANDAALLAEVHHDWNGYRILAAGAFLLLLGLALLSMREPVADIGTGVPFYPASLPPNLAIVDAERAVVIEHEDGHVRQKVDSLQQRLDESERLRLKAEARLQQALTTLGTGGRNVPGLPPEPPTPTLPASRGTSGRRPDPLPTPADTRPVAPAAAPTVTPPVAVAPAAAAAAAPDVAASSPKHASKKRTSRRGAAKPAPEGAPAPRRSRADEPVEAPASPPAPERVAVVADDVTVSAPTQASPEAASAKDTWPEVVVLPTEQPSTVGGKPAAKPRPQPAAKPASPSLKPATAPAEPDHAEDVLASVTPADETEPLDDPADLRARLARTAALKKPGSKERQDQRDALQHDTSEQ